MLWDHRRICGQSLIETSLCGAYLYFRAGMSQIGEVRNAGGCQDLHKMTVWRCARRGHIMIWVITVASFFKTAFFSCVVVSGCQVLEIFASCSWGECPTMEAVTGDLENPLPPEQTEIEE